MISLKDYRLGSDRKFGGFGEFSTFAPAVL